MGSAPLSAPDSCPPLSLRQLSELLWSANGVNRDDGSVTPRLDIGREFGNVSLMPPVRAGGQTAIAAKAGVASPQ